MEGDTQDCSDEHEHGHAGAPAAIAPEALARAAGIFRALSDPHRLWLLERLSYGPRCVSELAAESGDGLSTISQRLRVLRNEKLVERTRRGKHIDYELADDHVAELLRGALAHALHD